MLTRATSPLLKPRPKAVAPAVWYTLAAFGFALILVLIQIVLFTQRREPRNSQQIVQRELRLNTLQPGERVVRSLPVYRRSGVDYFRRTGGVLVLTDRRLIYLGAPPRDIMGTSDAAPTFDQREFPIDTLVTLERSFVMLGFSRAIKVASPSGNLELGVSSEAWPNAQSMRKAWDAQHRTLHTIGAWAERVRDARRQLERDLAAYRKQPVYHVVRAGDAISSIASWYEVSPDKVRSLNGIVGNKIKVGQKLLIRGGS